MTEKHNGVVSFKNNWGEDLYSITIRHRRSNDPAKEDEHTHYNISSGHTVSDVMKFIYETGEASGFDYWWIKFTTNLARTYSIKSNFYCSVSPIDDGKVLLRIDDADKEMYVTFSNSDGCQVSISPD